MTTGTSKPHQKHTALARPAYGDFGRLELGILGAPCAVIRQYVEAWLKPLTTKWNVAYVDADHHESEQELSPASLIFTDKISHRQIAFKKTPNAFENRVVFNSQDLVLVNSNHFKAQRQVVIIHPKKSLEHKLDKLTDVALILIAEGCTMPAYLSAHLSSLKPVPVLAIDDEPAITLFINNFIEAAIAPLNGLVLAGGKSTRMQADKASIVYHDKSQREHGLTLLAPLCAATYISSNSAGENCITDTFTGLGPFGGILSAMQVNPNAAWLTIACDLPYLSANTLNFLTYHRNPAKLATAFLDSSGKFPEPLITIWEPRAYPVMLQFLSQGYSCPRKVLINSDIELLNAPDVAELKNVNFPAERDEALKFFSLTAPFDPL